MHAGIHLPGRRVRSEAGDCRAGDGGTINETSRGLSYRLWGIFVLYRVYKIVLILLIKEEASEFSELRRKILGFGLSQR